MSANPDTDSNNLPDPVTTLWAEPAEIWQLRGGNNDTVTAFRVEIQALIDHTQGIKDQSEAHNPFNLPAFWTDQGDSNSFIPETALPDMCDDMIALLKEMRTKLGEHAAAFRHARTNDITDYSSNYEALSKQMKQVLQQRTNFVRCIGTMYCDHSEGEVGASNLLPYTLDSNVMSTTMTVFDKIRAADGTIAPKARFYDNGSEVLYPKLHLANFNDQSLRTFKNILDSFSDPYNNTSITLTNMVSKYAGSDMEDVSSSLSEVSTKFKDFIQFHSNVTSSALLVKIEMDEYWEESRNSTDGNLNASTDNLKKSILAHASYTDGVDNVRDISEFQPVNGDLLRKLFEFTTPLINKSSWNMETELA